MLRRPRSGRAPPLNGEGFRLGSSRATSFDRVFRTLLSMRARSTQQGSCERISKRKRHGRFFGFRPFSSRPPPDDWSRLDRGFFHRRHDNSCRPLARQLAIAQDRKDRKAKRSGSGGSPAKRQHQAREPVKRAGALPAAKAGAAYRCPLSNLDSVRRVRPTQTLALGMIRPSRAGLCHSS